MKKLLIFSSLCVLLFSITASAFDVGFVSVKECMEKSVLGKTEKDNLEKLKKQFSEKIESIETELTALAKKLQDDDYLESLSESASNELKNNFEQLNQEYNAYHSQYYQIVNQANYQILQSLLEAIKEASHIVRKDLKLDVIFHEDSIFAIDKKADVTDKVIALMNQKSNNKK